MDNINRHVARLRQLAVAAKAAGDADDYAMDAGSEGAAPARDPASLQRVELVQKTSGKIERITPQLITAAQVCDTHLPQFSMRMKETIKKSNRNRVKFCFVSCILITPVLL